MKAALHVESSPATSWPGPPDGWQYTSSVSVAHPESLKDPESNVFFFWTIPSSDLGYNACNDAPGKPSMIDFYRMIAPKLRTTIVPPT